MTILKFVDGQTLSFPKKILLEIPYFTSFEFEEKETVDIPRFNNLFTCIVKYALNPYSINLSPALIFELSYYGIDTPQNNLRDKVMLNLDTCLSAIKASSLKYRKYSAILNDGRLLASIEEAKLTDTILGGYNAHTTRTAYRSEYDVNVYTTDLWLKATTNIISEIMTQPKKVDYNNIIKTHFLIAINQIWARYSRLVEVFSRIKFSASDTRSINPPDPQSEYTEYKTIVAFGVLEF